MKYGFVMPPFDTRAVVDPVYEAEQAGWDGFFISEAMWSVDAWLCLAAAAMRTETTPFDIVIEGTTLAMVPLVLVACLNLGP
jgi:hypothetical protein